MNAWLIYSLVCIVMGSHLCSAKLLHNSGFLSLAILRGLAQ